LLGVGFYLLNTMLGRFALVFGFPPLLAALTPSLLFLGFGIDAIRRIR
jgi:lipopolysaccharide export system permease protein